MHEKNLKTVAKNCDSLDFSRKERLQDRDNKI